MAVEVYRLEMTAVVVDHEATAKFEDLERIATALERRRPTVHARANTSQAAQALTSIAHQANRLAQTPITLAIRAADHASGTIRSVLGLLASPLGLLGAGAGIGALTAWPLRLAGNLEQTQLSFRTFLGSQERALAFQHQLNDLADISPFETSALEAQATGLLQLTKNGGTTIRTMKAMGDAAALTGAGMEGMGRATVGLQQMFSQGIVQQGEASQVAEGLRIPLADIRKELGLFAGQDFTTAGIRPVQFLNAMNKVLERPVARGGFLGGMGEQAKTLLGMVSTVGDVVKRNLIEPWGEGLKDEIQPRLASLIGFFKDNAELTARWGTELRAVSRALSGGVFAAADSIAARVRSLLSSADWAGATSGTRAGLIWQKLIVDPLNAWWRSSGREQVESISGAIGRTLGGGLSGVIVGALGGDAKEGDNTVMQAGVTAGQAFMEGFGRSFSWQAIWDALIQDITNSKNPMPSIFKPGRGPSMDDIVRRTPGVGDVKRAGEQIGAATSQPGARRADPTEPLTRDQYNDRTIRAQFRAAGLSEEDVESACGPIMAAGFARALGRAADPAELAKYGVRENLYRRGPGKDPNSGMIGGDQSIIKLLAEAGVEAAYTDEADAIQRLQRGETVGLNAPNHYMLATGYDPKTQTFDLGATGTSIKGGSSRMTLAQIRATVGAPSFIRGQARGEGTAVAGRGFGSGAAQLGSAELPYGSYQPDSIGGRALRQADEFAATQGYSTEERKAIRAVLIQEGGAAGNLNNQGSGAAGLWQLYGSAGSPGELNGFAARQGVGIEEARRLAQTRPDLTTQYALGEGGYMRRAIEQARAQGLTGAQLAVYLQRYGQRSESPEKAGATYDRLFAAPRSNALGGMITEPVVGVGLSSGAGYSFAENRPERVVDTAGASGGHSFDLSGMSFNLHGADLGSASGRRAAASALVDDVLREFVRRVGGAAKNTAFAARGS